MQHMKTKILFLSQIVASCLLLIGISPTVHAETVDSSGSDYSFEHPIDIDLSGGNCKIKYSVSVSGTTSGDVQGGGNVNDSGELPKGGGTLHYSMSYSGAKCTNGSATTTVTVQASGECATANGSDTMVTTVVGNCPPPTNPPTTPPTTPPTDTPTPTPLITCHACLDINTSSARCDTRIVEGNYCPSGYSTAPCDVNQCKPPPPPPVRCNVCDTDTKQCVDRTYPAGTVCPEVCNLATCNPPPPPPQYENCPKCADEGTPNARCITEQVPKGTCGGRSCDESRCIPPTPPPTSPPTPKCDDADGDGMYESCKINGNGPACPNGDPWDCPKPMSTPTPTPYPTPTPTPPPIAYCQDSNGDNIYDMCAPCDNPLVLPLCTNIQDCLRPACVDNLCKPGGIGELCNPDAGYNQCKCEGPDCQYHGACVDSDGNGIYDSCKLGESGPGCDTRKGIDDCNNFGKCQNRLCIMGATSGPSCLDNTDCICDNNGICDRDAGENEQNCSNDCRGCPNGAINPPRCDQCPANYVFINNQCVPECTNGAINPPGCNQCAIGYVFCNGQCVPGDRCPDDQCPNGAINPPRCDQCPIHYSMLNGQCRPDCGNGICEPEKGETKNTCPQDCRSECGNNIVEPGEECDAGRDPQRGNGVKNSDGAYISGCNDICKLDRSRDLDCLACGCVEKTALYPDKNEEMKIAGDLQPVRYQIIVGNKSNYTPSIPVRISDAIGTDAAGRFPGKVKFQNNDPQAGAQIDARNEGYIDFPTQAKLVENKSGALVRDIHGNIVTVGSTFAFAPGIGIADGKYVPLEQRATFSVEGLKNKDGCSDINYKDNNPLNDCNRIVVEYIAQARTSRSGNELQSSTDFVRINNQASTQTNNDYADLVVSKSYVSTGNAGSLYFGNNGKINSLDTENLGKLQTGNNSIFNNISGLIVGGAQGISSYLSQILGIQSGNYGNIDQGGFNINRGSGASSAQAVGSESNLNTLAKRPDGAEVYKATNGLRIGGSGDFRVSKPTTIVVENGDLEITSNIIAENANTCSYFAIVVLNGNIFISKDVSRLDGVFVTKNGIISGDPDGTKSPVQLNVNGSLFGKINPLLNQRTFVAPPGQNGAAVQVNYNSKILTCTPPGLKDILSQVEFQQVSGGR